MQQKKAQTLHEHFHKTFLPQLFDLSTFSLAKRRQAASVFFKSSGCLKPCTPLLKDEMHNIPASLFNLTSIDLKLKIKNLRFKCLVSHTLPKDYELSQTWVIESVAMTSCGTKAHRKCIPGTSLVNLLLSLGSIYKKCIVKAQCGWKKAADVSYFCQLAIWNMCCECVVFLCWLHL